MIFSCWNKYRCRMILLGGKLEMNSLKKIIIYNKYILRYVLHNYGRIKWKNILSNQTHSLGKYGKSFILVGYLPQTTLLLLNIITYSVLVLSDKTQTIYVSGDSARLVSSLNNSSDAPVNLCLTPECVIAGECLSVPSESSF